MSLYHKFLIYFLVVFCVLALIILSALTGVGGPIAACLIVLYGWVFYLFVRYRHARQDELLNVIRASVEAQLPLAASLSAYLRDRPSSGLYRFSVGLLLHLAVAPYYWAWHRQHAFDRRTEKMVELLESGHSLSEALNEAPALASHETRIAVAMGESTGRLADFLRRADRERTTAAWLELFPRLIYPFLLFMIVCGVLAFFMVVVAPRLKRIYDDFKLPLPWNTLVLLDAWQFVTSNAALLILGAAIVVIIFGSLFVSPSFRWYFPIVGRLYSWDVHALVLRSLGSMVEFGCAVPDAIELIKSRGDMPPPVIRQLSHAHRQIMAGQSLEIALQNAGLLPRSALPFLQAAQRTRTTGWAMRELGQQLGTRALRVGSRLAVFVSPLLVLAIGAIVGVVVTGIFMPLVDLIEGLST